MADIRRVVTGHSAEGRAIFLQDGPPSVGAGALAPIWATGSSTRMGQVAGDPTESMGSWIPAPGETRFHMVVVPPASAQPVKAPGTPPPGFENVVERDAPGMHTTQTVDYDIIISGSMFLELDDGNEVELRPGDVVIQNGTRHAWRNRGTEPCVMYAVMVGVAAE